MSATSRRFQVRSERSPLHDVRQHARRNGALGQGTVALRDFLFHGRAFASNKRSRLASPLVEPDGIEPTTSCLQSRRSPN
jgi:hypothetical protein